MKTEEEKMEEVLRKRRKMLYIKTTLKAKKILRTGDRVSLKSIDGRVSGSFTFARWVGNEMLGKTSDRRYTADQINKINGEEFIHEKDEFLL